MLKIKRVYDKYDKSDGFRVLVDRLWPRGLSKESSRVDLWLKEIAPSQELRQWFNHDPLKWEEFQTKYKKELLSNTEAGAQLIKLVKEHTEVTLLYAAKDEIHNNAVVLLEYFQ